MYLDLEKDLFQKILIANCKKFPVKKAEKDQQVEIINLVDKILVSNENHDEIKVKFLRRFKSNFKIDKYSKK